MEDAARLEAKQIISQYMASYSVSQMADVSFSEREHLAELHKQIELRKTYRDSLRSVNLGLYALKQGMRRYGSDAFEEQLAQDYHATIRQVVEKQQEKSHGLQQLCYEYTMLGNSRQVLIEQAELQKLQGVSRLQEQVRAKLASTRVVKQWEREKATLLSEQKDMSKLEVVGKEIIQKRNEMLERKNGEIANTLICIGEGLEKAEELRMKLAEITKKYRDELHDDQSSDVDLRSEDGKKDAGAGENDRATNTAPMFDSIDWNLGSVSMDLRLDLNFKNPNDFPDILTHLSTINTSKYHLKDVKQNCDVKVDKQKVRNANERPKSFKKGNRLVSGNTAFSGDVPTPTKKSKQNDATEKVVLQAVSNDVGNVPAHDNSEKYQPRAILATPQPLQKQNNENVANLQHKVSRKKTSMTAQHETCQKRFPILEKKATPTTGVGQQDGTKGQEMNSGSSQSRVRTPASKAFANITSILSNTSKIKREPQSTMQQQYQQRGQLEKKQVAHQKQTEQPKRTRSMKVLSPAGTNQPKPVGHNSPADSNEPTPMEVDSDDNQDGESSTSNNSLDFGMQSGSCEFDLNLSGDLRREPEANADDDLDFLSMKPGRVTRSQGQKKKTNSGKSTGSGDDMDTFDFTFGGSNSSESLVQPEDLF